MDQITLTLTLHDACVDRPNESGKYLCGYNGSAYWMTMYYSKMYDAFNVSDGDDDNKTEIEVDFWCDLPDMGEKEEMYET